MGRTSGRKQFNMLLIGHHKLLCGLLRTHQDCTVFFKQQTLINPDIKAERQRKPDSEVAGDWAWVNNLNLFFNRFDHTPTPLLAQSSTICTSPLFRWETSWWKWRQRRLRVQMGSAPGFSSPVHLCRIVKYPLNMSLKLGKVPMLWKTSCVLPVPKNPHPKDFISYRPVALTHSSDEDPWAAGVAAWQWSGQRHHLPPGLINVSPGKAWKHCEDYVPWFLQCFRHHTACMTWWHLHQVLWSSPGQ